MTRLGWREFEEAGARLRRAGLDVELPQNLAPPARRFMMDCVAEKMASVRRDLAAQRLRPTDEEE